jgi:xanthosine utilization system XapX-like protein
MLWIGGIVFRQVDVHGHTGLGIFIVGLTGLTVGSWLVTIIWYMVKWPK